MKDGQKFVLTTYGEQYVMEITDTTITVTTGIKAMVWLFVDNLDIKSQVGINIIPLSYYNTYMQKGIRMMNKSNCVNCMTV